MGVRQFRGINKNSPLSNLSHLAIFFSTTISINTNIVVFLFFSPNNFSTQKKQITKKNKRKTVENIKNYKAQIKYKSLCAK